MKSRWSVPIDRLAAKAGLRLETVARKITFELFKAVTLRSPVDTGRFRANWNVSWDVPNFATGEQTNANRANAEILKVVAQGAPMGGVTYLSNGLPYARRLEYGWSRQAPAGMVRISVAAVASFVRKAIAS